MNTRILPLALLLAPASAQAQFSLQDVQYWVGSGTDSSVLVIDFQDGSFDGQSFAWGYLHDGTATAGTMLNDVAAADTNLDVAIVGGFLNDITYGVHAGIGGAPDYWSTWTGTDIATMAMNSGIGEVLSNGEWFGCSYTDFAPALAPTEPFAAFAPFQFTASDVTYWVGTGMNSAVLVIDFQDGSGTDSYAWGYRFDGTTDGQTMMNAIAAADPLLEVVIVGGFLNDITYGTHAGIGGSPAFWSTWSATNLGNWSMNMGVSDTVTNGELFGCSYTDFAPALRPDLPVAASGPTSLPETSQELLQAYPQPATDLLHLNTGHAAQAITVYDITGRHMARLPVGTGVRSLDVSTWPAGAYVVHTGTAKRTIVVQ